MISRSTEGLVAGAAFFVTVGSFAWFVQRAPVGNQGGAWRMPGSAYVPAQIDAANQSNHEWRPPVAQKRGAEWLYDVFTPPEIFYDPVLQRFTVKPSAPAGLPERTPPEPEFEVSLLKVERSLFRLQLVGFGGDKDNYFGIFENALTTETFLARGGERVAAMELVIEDFTVSRMPVELADSMTTLQLIASARVRDERSGLVTELTSIGRSYTQEPVATIAVNGEMKFRIVREHDQFEVNGDHFAILGIQLSPASVVIGRTAAGEQAAQTRTFVSSAAKPPLMVTSP